MSSWKNRLPFVALLAAACTTSADRVANQSDAAGEGDANPETATSGGVGGSMHGGGAGATGNGGATGNSGATGNGGLAGNGGRAGGMDGGPISLDDAPSSAVNYSASASIILNPERGFYTTTDLATARDLGYVRSAQKSLVYGAVHLDHYLGANHAQDLPQA